MRFAKIVQLLAEHDLLDTASISQVPDLEITGIVSDSRLATPGSVFIAIAGNQYDGHDFIAQALQNGAGAVIGEHPTNLHIPTLTVVNSRKAQAILSAFWWGYPAEDLLSVGITGTNGKTTTCFMIDAILEEAGYLTGIIGTVLTKVRGQIIESTMTTPDAWQLHHLLHHMVEKGVEAVAMEVSSHALVQDRCYGLPFDIGILTNITHDHFDLHPNLDHYIRTKGSLFNLVRPDGLALANGDDPLVSKALTAAGVINPVLFGLSPNCRIRGTTVVPEPPGIHFTLSWDTLTAIGGWSVAGGSMPVQLKVPGMHNVYNAIGAASVGLFLGISPAVIRQALTAFPGVSRRLQYIYQGEITVLDDFAHNPASLKTAINAALTLKPRRLVIVHSIRGNRGITINRENAETIVECTKTICQPTKIILTNSKDVVGEHDRVRPPEKGVFLETLHRWHVPFTYFPKLRKALEFVVETAQPGDLILLLGAQGMDAGSRVFREVIANYPEIEKADPYDELSSEPAIMAIPDYLRK